MPFQLAASEINVKTNSMKEIIARNRIAVRGRFSKLRSNGYSVLSKFKTLELQYTPSF